MQKRWKEAVLVACVLGAGALAADARNTLYVQVPSVSLQDVPGAKGSPVGDPLKRGASVEWVKADAVKGWHHVKANGKAGVLFQAVLGSKPPSAELTASSGSARSVSSDELASSGAATKALSEGAVTYGKTTGHDEAVRQLLMAEAVSPQLGVSKVESHAKKLGLPVPQLSEVSK